MDAFGAPSEPLQRRDEQVSVDVVRQFSHPLVRILVFFDLTIDDVVNRPEIKRRVASAYKASRMIHRSIDAKRNGRALRWGMHG